MQSQERDLITDLFGRLKAFESQPRDGEAERLIADLVRSQPASPYLLAQTVLVQEQALKAAQERIAELEKNKPAASGGFLGSAPRIGPWGAQPSTAPDVPQPSTRSPLQAAVAPQQPAAAAGGGGSFMRTALTTAAGVAGGALLFEGVRNMLGHGGGPFASHAAAAAPAQAAPLLGPTDDNLRSADADVEQDDDASDDYDTADDSDSGSGGSDSDDT